MAGASVSNRISESLSNTLCTEIKCDTKISLGQNKV